MLVRKLEANEQDFWQHAIEHLGADHHAFHWSWINVFSSSFGHRAHYFVAQDDEGNPIGLLPVYHFKSALFGEALISVPYLNSGGVIAKDAETVRGLVRACCDLGQALGVKYVELRHSTEQLSPEKCDASRSHKVTMLLELPSDPEQLFSSFPPKLRSQIRRPTKSGLYAESIPGADVTSSHIDQFYSVFSEHMRDLGTPVYPKSLFRNTLREFAKQSRLILVKSERRAVAVGITIGAKNRTEILWASSLRSYNKQSPNMLLYWEAIKGAVLDGYRLFDFGRSTPDSGTYRFKKQWGAQPQELTWHYLLFSGELPDVNPNSPKFQFLVNCWKRLPLPIANTIGPILTRGIP